MSPEGLGLLSLLQGSPSLLAILNHELSYTDRFKGQIEDILKVEISS